MTDPTVPSHRSRRTTNRATPYPSVEPEPEDITQSIATKTPISHAQPDEEYLWADSLDAGLRDSRADSEDLAKLLSRTAAEIDPATTDESSSLQARIAAWCNLHGYDPDDMDTLDILARQAVFAEFLKATLYEWHHNRGAVPALTEDVRKAFQIADGRVDSPAFEESILDDIMWTAENIDVRELVAARDQLLTPTTSSSPGKGMFPGLSTPGC